MKFSRLRHLISLVDMVYRHPLGEKNRFWAFIKIMRYVLGTTLLPNDVLISFVSQSRLIVPVKMPGSIHILLVRMQEFCQMGFLLHFLRLEEEFVDVGANIGSFTILAGAGVGARCYAFEANPHVYNYLKDNVYLNLLQDRVQLFPVAVGSEESEVAFTLALGATNHVMDLKENNVPSTQVKCFPLDKVLAQARPRLIKIDVEGFETKVIAGAKQLLKSETLLAVIMEMGEGNRYGFQESELHNYMVELGFQPMAYQPLTRTLVPLGEKGALSGTPIYIRQLKLVESLLKTAKHFEILGKQI